MGTHNVKWSGAVLKREDEDRRLVTGIVLEPDEVDTQSDTVSPETIELAAFRFLASYNKATRLGRDHEVFGEGIHLVESWIARSDQLIGGQPVKKGSWLITVHVADLQVWQTIRSGGITGFSIGGTGNRTRVGSPLG